MSPLDAIGANAEQIRYWNETAGPKWVELQDAIDAQIRPFGLRVMERASPGSAESIIDVGCGCGDTTIELARRVGPRGSVLGIDISTRMLQRAAEAAGAAGLTGVRFENADAQTYPFPARSFDLLYSRFGVMFFTDPTAAFANLRSALRRGGRLAFVCWQSIQQNPWMLVPLMAAAEHITLPPPPPPEAPGPFSFADPDRLRMILSGAGFVDVVLEERKDKLALGGSADLDRAVDFIMQIGPTAAALREADPASGPKVTAAVRDALRPYATEGGVRMESATWIVTARSD